MLEVHSDYCFMGASGDEKTKAIIVAKHLDLKSVLTSVVSVKGYSWFDEEGERKVVTQAEGGEQG